MGSSRDGNVPLLALVGATASGKTEASLDVARSLSAEIVYADSAAMYRGMDVATTKPSPEQLGSVRHHMVDVVVPPATTSVQQYQLLANRALEGIRSRGSRALVVAGSGLYYRALVDRFRFPRTDPEIRTMLQTEAEVVGAHALHRRLRATDPESAARISPDNARRIVRALEVAAATGVTLSSQYEEWKRYPAHHVIAAGIDLPAHVLQRRIEARVHEILPRILEETERLVAEGHRSFLSSCPAIGYREAIACLEGRASAEETGRAIVRRHKHLARRQLAWFRRDPRIQWFRAEEEGGAGIVDELVAYFEGNGSATRAAGRRVSVEV